MKTKLFVFVLLVLTLPFCIESNLIAQPTWSQQVLSPPNGGVGNYLSIQFLNHSTGWASGYSSNSPNLNYGVLLKTTNSGDTWSWINIGLSTTFSIQHFFINSNTGWIWISSGQIKKTTDGGNSWIDQSSGGGSLTTLYFINSQTGYATGSSSGYIIKKTTNGGTNWVTISSASVNLNKIKFYNELTGWTSSTNHYFARTTDGGVTWTQTLTENNYDFFFLNAQTGWITIPGVSTTPAVIKRTNDGGVTWSSAIFPSGTNTYPNSIKFFDQNTGWCASNNGVFRTTNGGTNWISQNNTPNMYDLSYSGRDSIWACGMQCILKTTNGTALTVTQLSSSVPNAFTLKQNFPNPFNPETKISFDIKNSTFASLKVFDMTGKEVKTLMNENISAGSYEINFNASELNSGVYFYTLKTNEFTETKKLMLVK